MRVILFALLAFPLLFSGTGCVMTPKQPALHDFGLPRSTANDNNQTTSAAITVDAPTWLWDNRIRYRLLYASPTHVGFYALDQWVASPPELLQQHLVSSLLILDKTLVIQLLEFEQQFEAPGRARVVLHFIAEAFSPEHKRKLGAHEFFLQQPANTPDASGAIQGLSRLVRQADERIRSWIMKLPDK